MQAPLPRRSKGPSAIAAASAALNGPDSGSGKDSEPGAKSAATVAPLSAAAAAFAAGRADARPDRAGADTADAADAADAAHAALRPPVWRRLPRAVLLAGVAVVGAALIGGAFLVVGGGDVRPSASTPDDVPQATGGGGPYESTPGGLGPALPSVSPSADGESASPQASATASAAAGDAQPSAKARPSATTAAADHAKTGSGGDDGGAPCTPIAGSGPITGYSACVSAGTVTLRATFHTSQKYYHAFIDTDGDTATGYRLPYPSPSVLGADYMIENGVLYRSLSSHWSWTEVGADPGTTVSGSTHTWTLPLSGIHAPTGTQRVEFHAGTDYTQVITFSAG
ncbi:hypothetical protein OG562_22355 [Streptomyces sp. NBC_01275]|uniref:hypothetical protein n=1 Tax=Streptomyces sp. NBC_01275 TaxID=2903807 RepID=UPI00224F5295|nr:hypothetical protein [Streptomyces sp. NBC_01275]MCX4763654.1 hypothetical protein [Streptomyces sp. NBC_01275]